MAVTFVSAGESVDDGVISKPAGLVDGDVMVAAVANREGRSDSLIVGWTKVAQPMSSNDNCSLGVWWKPAEEGDPDTWEVVTSGGAVRDRTTVLGYRGADVDDAVEMYSENDGVGGTKRWLSITPVESSLIVMFVSVIFDELSLPSGVTERWPFVAAPVGSVSGWGGDKVVTPGVATGDFTAGALDNNGWGTVLLALRPGGPQWTVGRGDLGARHGQWN